MIPSPAIDKHFALAHYRRLATEALAEQSRCPKAEAIRAAQQPDERGYGMHGLDLLINRFHNPAVIKVLICDNFIAMRRNRATLKSQGRDSHEADLWYMGRIQRLRSKLVALLVVKKSWHQMTLTVPSRGEAVRLLQYVMRRTDDQARVVRANGCKGWIIQAWREDA